MRVSGAQQRKLVSISQGRHRTHLLGGIDNASVVAELQGAKHCPSHGQHEAARQLLQREKHSVIGRSGPRLLQGRAWAGRLISRLTPGTTPVFLPGNLATS